MIHVVLHMFAVLAALIIRSKKPPEGRVVQIGIRPLRTDFSPSVHPPTTVHVFIFLMVRRLNPSMRWTVCLRTAVYLRPSVENNHGLSSVSVNEMDGSHVKSHTSVHLP